MSFKHRSTADLEDDQRTCMEHAKKLKGKKSPEAQRQREKVSDEFTELSRELNRRKLAEQTRVSPLIKTLTEDRLPRYCLADGTPVNQSLAEECIAHGNVAPLDSGLMDNPQSWRVR